MLLKKILSKNVQSPCNILSCSYLPISCHEIIFRISYSTSFFLFHSYFWGPIHLNLIVSTVVVKLKFYMFYIFIY